MFVNACPTPGTGEIEQPQMLPSKSFSDEFAHAHSSLFCQMQLVAERLLSQLLSFLVCPGGMHKPPHASLRINVCFTFVVCVCVWVCGCLCLHVCLHMHMSMLMLCVPFASPHHMDKPLVLPNIASPRAFTGCCQPLLPASPNSTEGQCP